MVSLRALRRLSAWALPRPSATASAKLAKSTVNQSQMASCAMKPRVGRGGKDADGGQHRADHGDEHDRVLDHQPRVELLETNRRSPGPTMFQIEKRAELCDVMSIDSNVRESKRVSLGR